MSTNTSLRNPMFVPFAIGVLLLLSGATASVHSQSAIGTVVTVTGYVLNVNTLAPVEAAYSVYDGQGKKVGQSHRASEKDGFLITGLQPGQMYKIRIEDPRYFKQEFAINLPAASKYTEISKDLVVRPLEVGRRLMLVPAPFDLKKDEIKTGTEEDMAELAKTLMMNPNVHIELVCYPDEQVSDSQASAVSMARGTSLKTFLEHQGVNGSRITVKQVKGTDPINPPPLKKGAKGKRYVGSVYLVVTKL
jgi:outer membrane protein OmpA-like peptidoglycan-associated protein